METEDISFMVMDRQQRTIDALVAALEGLKDARYDPGDDEPWQQADAAIALARGKGDGF